MRFKKWPPCPTSPSTLLPHKKWITGVQKMNLDSCKLHVFFHKILEYHMNNMLRLVFFPFSSGKTTLLWDFQNVFVLAKSTPQKIKAKRWTGYLKFYKHLVCIQYAFPFFLFESSKMLYTNLNIEHFILYICI